MLRSNLCDYCDAYIFVKGRISVTDLIMLTEGTKS